jgi:phosphopantothenoylcysteine synthetase/decarboxylase
VSQPGVGFDGETNAVTLVSADAEREVPLQSKHRVAAAILDRVEELMHARTAAPVRA